MIFQLSLFKRKTAEQALELASWMRVEMTDLRRQVKDLQTAFRKQENALNKLEGMLTELKQREIFED
jgi:hypothetical protein